MLFFATLFILFIAYMLMTNHFERRMKDRSWDDDEVSFARIYEGVGFFVGLFISTALELVQWYNVLNGSEPMKTPQEMFDGTLTSLGLNAVLLVIFLAIANRRVDRI